MQYTFYVIDTETTGLDPIKNDIIELSIYRLNSDVQKTWCLKPINIDNIEPGALRVNGHKIEDLLHQTKEGREKYLEAARAVIQIENFLSDDNSPSENRVIVAHNAAFDKLMLEQLWIKCNSKDTFPFGRRILDTMQTAFLMDYITNNYSDNYSLAGQIKKYGIKNDKSHTAASDTLATKNLFEAQIAEIRKKMNI